MVFWSIFLILRVSNEICTKKLIIMGIITIECDTEQARSGNIPFAFRLNLTSDFSHTIKQSYLDSFGGKSTNLCEYVEIEFIEGRDIEWIDIHGDVFDRFEMETYINMSANEIVVGWKGRRGDDFKYRSRKSFSCFNLDMTKLYCETALFIYQTKPGNSEAIAEYSPVTRFIVDSISSDTNCASPVSMKINLTHIFKRALFELKQLQYKQQDKSGNTSITIPILEDENVFSFFTEDNKKVSLKEFSIKVHVLNHYISVDLCTEERVIYTCKAIPFSFMNLDFPVISDLHDSDMSLSALKKLQKGHITYEASNIADPEY